MEQESLLKRITDQELEIKRLKEQILLKNQYISLVAHDFSGVSRNLLWIVDALKEGAISPEIFERLYPELKASIQTNQKTVDSTIAWVKAQDARFEIKAIAIKVYDVFTAIQASLVQSIKNKNINISFIGNENTIIYSDEILIKFILKTVIENAIKYSHIGGNVIFDIKETKSNDILIIIKDSGTGMAKEVLDNLFTFKGSPYTGTANEKGVGLSLIIAYDFLKLIGGDIKIDSIENQGSQIEIKLHGHSSKPS